MGVVAELLIVLSMVSFEAMHPKDAPAPAVARSGTQQRADPSLAEALRCTPELVVLDLSL